MFRLSKLTDYGIVLLAHLARGGEAIGDSGLMGAAPHNARELAMKTDLPAPAVSKVLKLLARQGIIESQRGAKGGYTLARRPEEISVTAMIDALEGPVAITECSVAAQLCAHEGSCTVQGPWQVINSAVRESLSSITLADLIDPGFGIGGAFPSIARTPNAPPRPPRSAREGERSGAGPTGPVD